MPTKSPKQKRLMQAACKSPSFSKKVGVSKQVACEFYKEDKAKAKKKK